MRGHHVLGFSVTSNQSILPNSILSSKYCHLWLTNYTVMMKEVTLRFRVNFHDLKPLRGRVHPRPKPVGTRC